MKTMKRRRCEQNNFCWLLLLVLIAVGVEEIPAFVVVVTSPTTSKKQPVTKLYDKSSSQRESSTSTRRKRSTADIANKFPVIKVGDCIGRGSYGTVHWIQVYNEDSDQLEWKLGKRPWTLPEITQQTTKPQNQPSVASSLQQKANRCLEYWQIERHCYQTIFKNTATKNKSSAYNLIAPFRGTGCWNDNEGTNREWLVFDVLASQQHQQQQPANPDSCTLAPSLEDLIEQDRIDRRQHEQHHLYFLSKALGLSSTKATTAVSLTDTLDVVMTQVLEILALIHSHKIVHRDIKPGNLLVHNNRITLIDFGSAADLSTAGGPFAANVGLSCRDVVAVSPIYAAPEVFIDNPNDYRSSVTFDCFSAGLLFCQLLFQYLDERTESGFHQQYEAAGWSLDEWLRSTMASKVQPTGLEDALTVLRERPGMWRLLQGLMERKPYDRISSQQALETWRQIVQNGRQQQQNEQPSFSFLDTPPRIFDDGPYLREALQQTETCLVELDATIVRPLHFVATFERKRSLGLVLAEVEQNGDANDAAPWMEAIQDARPGNVFIKEIIPGGQADEMGIFAVGDRLQGVGELPLGEGGFERAVELIQDQPKKSLYVTLHFDRKPTLNGATVLADAVGTDTAPVIYDGPIQVADQGAWSSLGRRKAQEDAFILHEIHDTKERSILLAGVMDGHLGRAASFFVRDELPAIYSKELLGVNDKSADDILGKAWEQVCQSYSQSCISGDECVADYDPREGLLMANTGSADAIAGTTACLFTLDKRTSHVVFLNCGDSRGLVVADGMVKFQTLDHTPEKETDRLIQGRQQGLDYSEPQCSVGKWTVPVGDYVYAVARSLEGPFATEKGIVWTPDVNVSQAEQNSIVLVATDGLWEVIDSEQASRILTKLRHEQSMSASDAAKTLCSLAIEKGSTDNVSVVVIYLD